MPRINKQNVVDFALLYFFDVFLEAFLFRERVVKLVGGKVLLL
jgi:hypothetical protein